MGRRSFYGPIMRGVSAISVRRSDYVQIAWTAPMRELAAKVGISNVALKKRFIRDGLTVPPQGYWNKVRAGMPVPRRPKVTPRGPGELETVEVDEILAPLFTAAPGDLRYVGPFATSRVPEQLEELREREIAALVAVDPNKARGPLHPAIDALLDDEHKSVFNRGISDLPPAFTSPPSVRHLAIINAIFRTLARRGYECHAKRHYSHLRCWVVVGSFEIEITVGIVGREFPPRTNLISAIKRAPEGAKLWLEVKGGREWQDDAQWSLNRMIGAISADIIVAGEATYRCVPMRSARRDAEYAREVAERAARTARERLEMDELHNSVQAASTELLGRAEALRAVAKQAAALIESKGPAASGSVLRDWLRTAWALQRDLDQRIPRLVISR